MKRATTTTTIITTTTAPSTTKGRGRKVTSGRKRMRKSLTRSSRARSRWSRGEKAPSTMN